MKNTARNYQATRIVHRGRGALRPLAFALVAILGFGFFWGDWSAAPAEAADTLVTSGADAGPGSLREAISSVDPADPDPVVTIQAGLEIVLEEELEIPDKLTVRGAEGALPVITFDNESDLRPGSLFVHRGERLEAVIERISVKGFPALSWEGSNQGLFHYVLETRATDVSVTFRDMDFYGVETTLAAWEAPGAQVLVERCKFQDMGPYRDGEVGSFQVASPFSGSLTVRDSEFERMWSVLVDADLTSGTVLIERSKFSGPGLASLESSAGVLNLALDGGAVPGRVPITIRDSVFSGVGADYAGVLLVESTGNEVGVPVAAEITGSSFIDTLVGDQAANALVMSIEDPGTSVVVQNSTFSLGRQFEDPFPADGGLARQRDGNRAALLLDHVTSSGPGVNAEDNAVVTLRDSALLTGETGVVFHGDDWWELEEGGTFPEDFTELDTSQVTIERSKISVPGPRFPAVEATPEAEFKLGELADNGGLTPTMMPGPGSVLIDAAAGELAVDQRGMPRPAGAASDVGAVEVQPSMVALETDVTAEEGQPLTFSVTRTGDVGQAATVQFRTSDGTAVAGANYTSVSGTLTWEAGDLEPQQVTVPTKRDGVVTDPLTLTLRLENPADGTLISSGAETRVGTITNVDEAVVTPPDPDPEPKPKPDPDPQVKPAPDPSDKPSPGKLAETGAGDQGALIWGAVWLVAAGALLVGTRSRRHGTRKAE